MDQLNSTTFTPDRGRGQHLKFEDRCSIRIYNKLGFSLRKTAEAIGCSASTVLNELRRGTGKRNGNRGRNPEYSAKRGQQNYEINRSRCHKPHKLDSSSEFVQWLVKQVRNRKWSFDACVGFAKKHNMFPFESIPCTKTLYNELWAGNLPLTPFDVPEALSRSSKSHKHRENKRILGTSIDERPEIASLRTECGHWEIDTVVGHKSGRESVVLTLVEKKTDYYIAVKIPGKDADSVMTAIEILCEEYGKEKFAQVFKTITADNGAEFERLVEIESWGVKIYFAHPYSSWERPQNERHNRLFRRYVPKGVSIEKYTDEQILWFADEMNDLPRRQLGFSTPAELFEEFLNQVYSIVKSTSSLIFTSSVQLEIAI